MWQTVALHRLVRSAQNHLNSESTSIVIASILRSFVKQRFTVIIESTTYKIEQFRPNANISQSHKHPQQSQLKPHSQACDPLRAIVNHNRVDSIHFASFK
jgi:hypothetical protein